MDEDLNSVRKFVSALALAVALAGLSQATPAINPVVKPVAGASKLGTQRVPDAQVERAIRAKFAKSKINAEHFTVSVQNGVATIEGKTNVIQHKGVATRLAKTGGAVTVENHIQVSEAARAKAAAKLAQVRTGETQVARATVIQPATPK
jgi:osmotically-inducible protein OsmY